MWCAGSSCSPRQLCFLRRLCCRGTGNHHWEQQGCASSQQFGLRSFREGSCTVHWRMTPLNTKPRGIWGGFQTSAVWSATESALRIHAKSSSVCHSFTKTTVPSHSLKKLHSSLPKRGTPTEFRAEGSTECSSSGQVAKQPSGSNR